MVVMQNTCTQVCKIAQAMLGRMDKVDQQFVVSDQKEEAERAMDMQFLD